MLPPVTTPFGEPQIVPLIVPPVMTNGYVLGLNVTLICHVTLGPL